MGKLVSAAATWLRRDRERLGWSIADFVLNAQQMASDMGWEGRLPTAGDLHALEAGELKKLPRWFKLLRYAADFASVPEPEKMAWLAERNFFWQAGRELRLSRPLLFEDEHRFINTLDALEEDHRRALRAFVTNFTTRQCYASKEEFARTFLQKFGITATVLGDEDREMVETLQKMTSEQRTMILDMLRNLLPDRHSAERGQ
jgi:transcriptional regulator with XRE-family HTH domain